MSDLPIKVLSRDEVEIAGFRRTKANVKYLSKPKGWGSEGDVAESLGWREILRMMDEFEEPKPEVGGSAPPYCVEHNCQMILSVYNRPGSPPGNGWSCPECANEREPKPAEKPTWEPGTVLVNDKNAYGYGWRLDQYMGNSFWTAVSMADGSRFTLKFPKDEWCVHRLPHEFKVGDWAQHDNHAPFKVRSTYPKGDDRYIYGEDGQAWLASSLRHVPAPKEAKPGPFQGEHWDANQISQASVDDKSWSAYRRDCDLRDELRRMKEGK